MNQIRKIAWGAILLLDLYDCNPKKINDKKLLKEFSKELCKVVDMKPYKNTELVNFGVGKIKGISTHQWIYTSSITIHFDNQFGNQVMLDLFTCKKFDKKIAVNFAKNYFEGKVLRAKLIQRGHR